MARKYGYDEEPDIEAEEKDDDAREEALILMAELRAECEHEELTSIKADFQNRLNQK